MQSRTAHNQSPKICLYNYWFEASNSRGRSEETHPPKNTNGSAEDTDYNLYYSTHRSAPHACGTYCIKSILLDKLI